MANNPHYFKSSTSIGSMRISPLENQILNCWDSTLSKPERYKPLILEEHSTCNILDHPTC